MRRAAGVLLAILAPAAVPLALACTPSTPRPQGTPIGTFAVHGSLEDNGCRPGFEPLDPLQFSVELRRDAATIVWRTNGGQPVGGSLRDDGSFRLVSRGRTEAWPADPANGITGCSLDRIETVSGTLETGSLSDAGADAGVGHPDDAGAQGDAGPSSRAIAFHADDEIEIVPVLGTDCSALLISNGGSFPSLPCSATYRLEAERTE